MRGCDQVGVEPQKPAGWTGCLQQKQSYVTGSVSWFAAASDYMQRKGISKLPVGYA